MRTPEADEVSRLADIKQEISNLVDEAERLVMGTSVEAHAKAYWIPWLRNMLEGDPSCMQGDIDDLRGDVEEVRESDEQT